MPHDIPLNFSTKFPHKLGNQNTMHLDLQPKGILPQSDPESKNQREILLYNIEATDPPKKVPRAYQKH
jgi:hypothetical protein